MTTDTDDDDIDRNNRSKMVARWEAGCMPAGRAKATKSRRRPSSPTTSDLIPSRGTAAFLPS